MNKSKTDKKIKQSKKECANAILKNKRVRTSSVDPAITKRPQFLA